MTEASLPGPAATPSRARTWGIFGAKIALAAILLGWLVRGGSLKFSALSVLVHPPWLLVLDLMLFMCSISLATARWRALLELCGARLSFWRAWRLQLLGIFFNMVIPGNVGGDIVKAVHVARDHDASKRPAILLIVVLERALGLAGLLVLGGTVVCLRAPMLAARGLEPLAWTVGLLACGAILGLAGFTIVAGRFGPRLAQWVSGTSRLARFLGKLVGAMILLSARPTVLVRALLYSVALHGITMAFFTILASHLSTSAVSYGDVATVFPLGVLTLILPISPSGFGIGHVAFDRLFTMVGIEGGATIFNVFLIGQLVPALSGIIPYLSLRRERREDSAA